MLKFPSIPTKNHEMSYANGCISEYIGSHIFNMLGVMAQETLLGTFNKDGKEKIIGSAIKLTLVDFYVF